MKNILTLLLLSLVTTIGAKVDFDQYFDGRTLRINYTFAGDSTKQDIFVSDYCSYDTWAGRRVNLDSLNLEGTADIKMRSKDGKLIYCHSFSTHFQDWTGIEQATKLHCSYEHVCLLPMPKEEVEIEIRLFDFKQRPVTSLVHKFDPKDILVQNRSVFVKPETKPLIASGSPEECIDVVIIAEGYTKDELPTFYEDAQKAVDAIFSAEPYKSNKNKFNFTAIGAVSNQSGVSEPSKNLWYDTVLGTFFDFLYTPRLIAVKNLFKVNDVASAVPYEHIIVLCNTASYGGTGVYNSYEVTPAHHPHTFPVMVHEFGHSFGGLGDEYFYDDQYTPYYYPDVEPWHDNLTTLCDFKRKWGDLMAKDTPIPTPVTDKQDKSDCKTVGVYEGGGYATKGVYRPAYNCRMRTNNAAAFCPVCERGIQRVIDFNLKSAQ